MAELSVPAQRLPSAHDRTVTQLHEIATGYAGGYHEGSDRADALARLAAASTDPDLLAHAAAMHAMAPNWYAIAAVDLLIEAGADQRLIGGHVDRLGPRDG